MLKTRVLSFFTYKVGIIDRTDSPEDVRRTGTQVPDTLGHDTSLLKYNVHTCSREYHTKRKVDSQYLNFDSMIHKNSPCLILAIRSVLVNVY